MTSRIRVGIVGVGWGSVVLVPAFRAVPEFEVVALCARRPERVAAAAAKLDIAETSTDWRSFVRRDDLDLIAIATPTDLHFDQTVAALEAGKHVLVEKPLALDEGQARQLADLAEASGRCHAVNFEGRWLSDRLPVWEMVRAGFIGEPYLARVTTAADYWHPSRPPQSEWMYRLDAGGGYLAGIASHDLDFICSLFGEPEAVCADVRTSVPVRRGVDGKEFAVDADDTSTVLLRMASGASAVVSTTTVGLGTNSRRLEIYGSAGSLTISGPIQAGRAEMVVEAVRVGEPGVTTITPSEREPRSGARIPDRRAGGAIRALALMLEDWLPAFDGAPTPTVPSLRDGWVVARLVDAARHSSAGAGWVTLEKR